MQLGVGLAQTDKIGEALLLFSQSKIEEAKVAIDFATEDSALNSKSKLWYYRGYLYKEYFKHVLATEQDVMKASQYRNESIFALKKCLDLDDKAEFEANTKATIRFLAVSMYNDAVMAMQQNQFNQSVKWFNGYLDAIVLAKPDTDVKAKKMEFNLALGSKYLELASDSTQSNHSEYLDLAINVHKKVRDLDSNNYEANYNLGVIYYNQAVDIVKNLPFEAGLFEIYDAQERSVILFKQAEPYQLRAFSMRPHRLETIESLSGIYYSLSETEKYNYYKELYSYVENLRTMDPNQLNSELASLEQSSDENKSVKLVIINLLLSEF